MSGLNPAWDALEDAYQQLRRANELRTSRVWQRYRVYPSDDLKDVLDAANKAIAELDAMLIDQADN